MGSEMCIRDRFSRRLRGAISDQCPEDGDEHTTRNPKPLPRLPVSFLLRLAERALTRSLFQDPPRSTRGTLDVENSITSGSSKRFRHHSQIVPAMSSTSVRETPRGYKPTAVDRPRSLSNVLARHGSAFCAAVKNMGPRT